MKRLRFFYDVEFDKFSEIRKIMRENGFDNINDFFSDFLKGLIEEKIEEELVDSNCISRELNFGLQEINKNSDKLSWDFPKLKRKIFKLKKLKKEV